MEVEDSFLVQKVAREDGQQIFAGRNIEADYPSTLRGRQENLLLNHASDRLFLLRVAIDQKIGGPAGLIKNVLCGCEVWQNPICFPQRSVGLENADNLGKAFTAVVAIKRMQRVSSFETQAPRQACSDNQLVRAARLRHVAVNAGGPFRKLISWQSDQNGVDAFGTKS